MREVIQSPCFNRIREEKSDFFKFIEEKVEAIEGDIVKHINYGNSMNIFPIDRTKYNIQ